MSRLFIGNFSFEQRWLPGFNVTEPVRRLEAELAPIWLAVAQDGDEILCPLPVPDEYWLRMRQLGCASVRPLSVEELRSTRARTLIPWGWTPEMREIARKLPGASPVPDQETVWRVNSREFGYECCSEQNLLLPGEGLARSLPQALEQIACVLKLASGWLIKPNQGQSGRHQMRGTALPIGKELVTLKRLIDRQKVVHIEPLLSPELELSGQWEIPRQGAPQLLGLTQLLTAPNGTYQATGWQTLSLPPSTQDQIVRSQRNVILQIQAAGYFGPVGIDAMIAKGENEPQIRPVQDVNARWTMGRIGWEWGERFRRQGGENFASGIWSHGRSPPTPESLPLSPRDIQATPVRQGTWWSPSRPGRDCIEEEHGFASI